MESMQFAPFFKEGFETYGAEETYSGTLIPDDSSLDPGSYCKPGSFSCRRFSMQRDSITTLQSVLFELPDLRSTLNLNKAAQGLSLLTQVFKRWQ